MSDDKIEVTERITFLGSGGSHHEWRLPDGTIWMVQDFEASPVLFQKRGMEWGLETAQEAGIASVLRITYAPKDEIERRDIVIDVLAHLVAAVSLLENGGQKAAASNKMYRQMLKDYHASIERGRDYLRAKQPPSSPANLDAAKPNRV